MGNENESSDPPELDYALVADTARIENGKIDILGGSFTRASFGPHQPVLEFAVVGRVRAREGADPIAIAVDLDMPGDEPRLTWAGTLHETDAHARYDGKVAHLFVVSVRLAPPSRSGLAEVYVRLNDMQVRRLAFDIAVQPR